MKVFPHSLIRSAALSFDAFICHFEKMITLKSMADEYLLEENAIALKKTALIQYLEQDISAENHNRKRKNLKKLKKKLQTAEIVNANDLILIGTLPKDLLANYSQEFQFFERSKNQAEELYNSLLAQERINLSDIFKKVELRNGLLLSSQILLQNLNKYTPDQKLLNKKQNQLEWSMYKYASRSAAKTSPFSSFTNVGATSFKSSINSSKLEGELTPFKSIIKFNSVILRHFIICLKVNKQYRNNFILNLNPSITSSPGHYHFLINKHNTETFQRLKKNQIIEIIIEMLPQQIEFSHFLNQLTNIIDDSENNIEFYLLNLIDSGFIEMHPGFSELDENWEQKLLSFIRNGKDSIYLENELKKLCFHKKSYEMPISIEEKTSLLSNMHTIYKEIVNYLISTSDYIVKQNSQNSFLFYSPDKSSPSHPCFSLKHIDSQNILYEDVLTVVDTQISLTQVKNVIEKLNSLISETKLYSNYNNNFFDALNFYKQNYKGEYVDLLHFYENFFRDKLKTKKISSSEAQNPISDQLKKKYSLRKSWETYFYQELEKNYDKKTDEFHFSLDLLKQTNYKLNLSYNFSQNSFSSFFQFFTHKANDKTNHLMAISNGAFSGYGKLYSRFLNDFPNEILDSLKHWNATLIPPNSIFAENIDSSIFNANHHPSIMDYEIQIPGIIGQLKQPHNIALKDLHIRYAPMQDELQLYHKKTGQRVYIFDLCFQALKSRSKLYQLLEIFSKSETISTLYLSNFYKIISIKGLDENLYKVKYYPRIIFEKNLIIRRSSWHVPKECIIEKAERSDFECFLIYNQWRHLLKIPDEIFVRIAKRQSKPDQKQKMKKDDYKPQYINFLSPISVRYFNKLVKKAETFLTIEEMLPNSKQLALLNDKSHATEFLIQWYND